MAKLENGIYKCLDFITDDGELFNLHLSMQDSDVGYHHSVVLSDNTGEKIDAINYTSNNEEIEQIYAEYLLCPP